jgi:hypothetical protein
MSPPNPTEQKIDALTCEWTQKWKGFNSWNVACRGYLGMYGQHVVAVPPDDAKFCCWCGAPIKFISALAAAARAEHPEGAA